MLCDVIDKSIDILLELWDRLPVTMTVFFELILVLLMIAVANI